MTTSTRANTSHTCPSPDSTCRAHHSPPSDPHLRADVLLQHHAGRGHKVLKLAAAGVAQQLRVGLACSSGEGRRWGDWVRGMACACTATPCSSLALPLARTYHTRGLQADHHRTALLHRLERHLRAVRHLAGLRWGRRELQPSGGWPHEAGAVPPSTAAQAACHK